MTQVSKPSVPAVVVEEHHEALIAMSKACRDGLIAREGNTLLHVDHHLDMHDCRLRSDFRPWEPESIHDLVYGQLGIGNYLTPACYHRLFHRTFWLTRRVSEHFDGLSLYSADGRAIGREPVAGWLEKRIPLSVVDASSHVEFPSCPLVLDLDLDYFDVAEQAGHSSELEITGDCYIQIRDNPYHKLRLLSCGFARIEERQGKFYASFSILAPDDPAPATLHEIEERVEAMIGFLGAHALTPQLITIARSRQSGFVRPSVSSQIEHIALAGLRFLYDLDLRYYQVSKAT